MDEPPLSFITFIFLVFSLLLVALNAFFVAAEFAIVKVRRTRLEELAGQGVRAAQTSILCVDKLDEYLSATQLGITLVSLGLGWIGEKTFYELFTLFIPKTAIESSETLHILAVGCAFFTITLLHVVLGELVPKSMAIQKSEQVTLFVSHPLRLFYKLAQPLIRAFTGLANIVLRLFGFGGLSAPPLSAEELKLVMRDSHEEGVISSSEAQIITRAFEFSDKRAADIMVPSDQVEFISLQRSIEENLTLVKSNMHTRFPLTENGLNSVIGVVHMKDVLIRYDEEKDNTIFERCRRPAIFVDPKMREDKILRMFKKRHTHLAIVQDPESKEVLGIVTMEDILEELVGDITDEHGN